MDSSVTPAYQSQRRQGDLPYLDASFTAAFANISALAIRITSVDGANGFLNAPVSVKYQPQNGVSQRSATATPYLLLPPPPRFCFPAQPPPTPASSASPSLPQSHTPPLVRPPARRLPVLDLPSPPLLVPCRRRCSAVSQFGSERRRGHSQLGKVGMGKGGKRECVGLCSQSVSLAGQGTPHSLTLFRSFPLRRFPPPPSFDCKRRRRTGGRGAGNRPSQCSLNEIKLH